MEGSKGEHQIKENNKIWNKKITLSRGKLP
jgi:hypothetical protein